MQQIRAKGFTLVELMITVVLLAIMAALAFPSFTSTIRSNRVATATNELLSSVALARTEAIRSRQRASICTTTDGTACGGDWNNGWLVWIDVDGNKAVNGTEAVIRYVQAHPQLNVIGPDPTEPLAFDGRGRSVIGGRTFDLRPQGQTTPVRCLILGPTGQTRVTKVAC